MAELDTTREELDQQEAELEAQRTEADSLLLEMMQAYEEMNADYEQNMADEAELSDEIAKSEAAYYAALSKEEAERIAALNRQNNNKGSNSNSSSGATNTGGWLYPASVSVSGHRLLWLPHAPADRQIQLAQRRGLRRGSRYGDPCDKIRHGHDGGLFRSLGLLCGHQPRRRLFQPLRAPAVLLRVRRRLRHAGTDHRLRRLHRLVDRPAPALHHLL